MENNTMKHGTAIAVVIAVVVVGFFFGGLIYQGNTSSDSSSSTASLADINTASSTTGTSTLSASSQYPMTTTPDGLQIQDITMGTGPAAQAGDTVTVNYVGLLTDGTEFDSSASHGQPFQFTLGAGQVIPGWDEGIVGMKVGGTRELVIPASLAYGSQAVGQIPANSTLVFQVQLVQIAPAGSSASASGTTGAASAQ